VNPDHLTILLTKKGKALMNNLDPDQRLKALAKLKAFVDAEQARISKEYEDMLKSVSEAGAMEPGPRA